VPFTYRSDLISPLDQTRFLIGDTDPRAMLFHDAEINGTLAIYENLPIDAAIALATAQAAKYARKSTMSVDGLNVQYGDLSKQFTALANQLRKQRWERPGAVGAPYVGGVSRADIITNVMNCDRPPSQFWVGMGDDPGGVDGGREWGWQGDPVDPL
jgi:hypothetical protein